MNTSEIIAIRQSNELRDDFLIHLGRKHKKTIAYITRKTIIYRATNDLISNECVQYFLLGCNRGIDQVRINDDGRGKHDIEKYITWMGFNNLKTFLRREFILKKEIQTIDCNLEDIEQIAFDPVDYAQQIISNHFISEYIDSLQEIDKKILYLILEGQYGNISVQNTEKGIIQNIATVLGVSRYYIYGRIYILRSIFTLLPQERIR